MNPEWVIVAHKMSVYVQNRCKEYITFKFIWEFSTHQRWVNFLLSLFFYSYFYLNFTTSLELKYWYKYLLIGLFGNKTCFSFRLISSTVTSRTFNVICLSMRNYIIITIFNHMLVRDTILHHGSSVGCMLKLAAAAASKSCSDCLKWLERSTYTLRAWTVK